MRHESSCRRYNLLKSRADAKVRISKFVAKDLLVLFDELLIWRIKMNDAIVETSLVLLYDIEVSYLWKGFVHTNKLSV